jgi:hypothetical protein
MELERFFQLVQNLGTAQVTTILDCGFTHIPPALRGNLQLRSRPPVPPAASKVLDPGQPSSAEGQQVWPPRPKGLLIAATTPQDLAAEAAWPGFHAGVLTYLLTQYLWETMPAARLLVAFNQVVSRRELGLFSCQHPTLEGKESSSTSPPLLPHSLPDSG